MTQPAAEQRAVPLRPSVPLILDSEIENAVDRLVARAESLVAELAQARAALAERERAAFIAGYGAGANDQAHFHGRYLNSPDAYAAWQASQPATTGEK